MYHVFAPFWLNMVQSQTHQKAVDGPSRCWVVAVVVVLVVDWGRGGVSWGLDDEGGWVIRGEDGLRGAWMIRGAHSGPQGNKVSPPQKKKNDMGFSKTLIFPRKPDEHDCVTMVFSSFRAEN